MPSCPSPPPSRSGRVGAGSEEVLDPGEVSDGGRPIEELLRFLLHSLQRPAKDHGGGGWGEAVNREREEEAAKDGEEGEGQSPMG